MPNTAIKVMKICTLRSKLSLLRLGTFNRISATTAKKEVLKRANKYIIWTVRLCSVIDP